MGGAGGKVGGRVSGDENDQIFKCQGTSEDFTGHSFVVTSKVALAAFSSILQPSF